MRVLIILLFSLLVGCSSTPIVPINSTVNIDSSMLEPCPLLPEDVVVNSFEDIQTAYANNLKLYGQCAIKQIASIKLLKQFSNK